MSQSDFKYRSEAVEYSQEELGQVLANFNRNINDVGEDIAIIRDWLKLQKHILIATTDREILFFLISCKFSLEKTKQKLNMYYCIRDMLPELYKNRKVTAKEFQELYEIVNLLALPKLSPNLNRVLIYNILDANWPKFKSDNFNAYIALFLDLQPVLDLNNGIDYIFDLTNLSLEYVLKYTIMDLKKLLTIIEKVYSTRIASLHIVNPPGYFDALLTVTKSFLKEKIGKRIIMHKGYKSLHEYFPKSMLPSDFGGESGSIAEIKKKLYKSFLEHDEHFEKLNGKAVDESLRPDSLQNDEILGFHGSFRKLQVD